ncbi:hypothetical protein [Sphingomonas xinjiangensis]|uniref:Uncharacterized protein n=1 Tax=Sphingomonas xinjiangensis TaxID=643568 RepID=A0A840YN44_9SPHN|nr:hypothetical protein [Sphingomonas xinjiangensis]MBB5711516.1 hypothetical protein [Sphingomonas xinjiangensis]
MKAPIALLGAALVGALAALVALVLPTAVLESIVMGSGLPALVAAAEPPLGFTARICLALGAGGFFGIMAGLTLFVLVGTKTVDLQTARPKPQPDKDRAPVLRRADAHPDAPPRPPLMAARDLGTPFLEVGADPQTPKPLPLTPRKPTEPVVERPLLKPEAPVEAEPLPLRAATAQPPATLEPVEQPLPEDLDQPLAAFDPRAVPDVPLPPPVLPPIKPKPEAVGARPQPVPVVVPATAPAERIEVFEVTPQQRAPIGTPAYPFANAAPLKPRGEEALARPETEASVHALLDRLERGVIRRGVQTQAAMPKPEPRLARGEDGGLEDTLASLRRMASRA